MAGSPFDIASTMLGKAERPNRAELQDYLTTGGANLDPATAAWCAAFVNSTLSQAGIKGTGSNMARSFLNFGQPVDKPQRGDIAVFSRGDPNGPFGHVGFFDSYGPDGAIKVLGGNQGDAVSLASYGVDRLLGFRRPGQPGPGTLAAPTPTGNKPQTAPPQGGLASMFAGPSAAPNGSLPVTAGEKNFGNIALLFAQQQLASQQRRNDEAEAEHLRRQALFDADSLASLYG